MEKRLKTEEAISLIKETYKPGLSIPILMFVIGFVLYWGIWMDLIDANYERLGILIIVTTPLMMFVGGTWTTFYFRMLQYKKEVRDYKNNPDSYVW